MASEDESEAQFVARLVARDESAFNELVVTYERRVFALVFRMLGRRGEAEDLAQEVFVQVFKAIDQFRGESKLSSFRDGWRHLRFLLVHSPNHLFILPGAVMAGLGALVILLVESGLELFGRSWGVHAIIGGA